jgi:mannitol-1-phosphate/altronate dehydrogenase
MVAPSKPMMVRITPDTTQVLAAMIAKSAIVHFDALLIFLSLYCNWIISDKSEYTTKKANIPPLRDFKF